MRIAVDKRLNPRCVFDDALWRVSRVSCRTQMTDRNDIVRAGCLGFVDGILHSFVELLAAGTIREGVGGTAVAVLKRRAGFTNRLRIADADIGHLRAAVCFDDIRFEHRLSVCRHRKIAADILMLRSL